MRTILIVDDSPTMRRMVAAALAPLAETRFIEAGTGLQAIEMLAVEPVQMILLDLSMPDMHGIEVLQFLRAHAQYRQLPVIVLTTRGDAITRDTAVSAGASLYMTKPFAPAALLEAVTRVLGSPIPVRRG